MKKYLFLMFVSLIVYSQTIIGSPLVLTDLTLKYGSYLQSLVRYLSRTPNNPTMNITVNSAANFQNTDNPNGEKIYPMWNRFNIWDPSRTPAGKTDFMEEAILMTATGGRQGYNEMYKGAGVYDFTRIDAALDNLISYGIIPTIVIGNVPTVLSNRPTDFGDFDANTGTPVDYNAMTQYHAYLTALFSHLQTKYGTSSIPPSQWEYRLMTEPDNTGWFNPYNSGKSENGFSYNETKFIELYDQTIDAIKTGLGTSSISLNPGNMMITPYLQPGLPSWLPDLAYMLKTDGYSISRFCFSLYGTLEGDGKVHIGGCQMAADPRELKSFVSSVRSKVVSYFPNASISIEEGELYTDENGKSLGFCGSNLGAAYLAAIFKNCYDVNLAKYTLWQLTGNGLKAPVYNTVAMYNKMRSQTRVQVTVPATTDPYVDGISSKTLVRLSTILFSYFTSFDNTPTNNVSINFSGLHKNGKYLLKTYVIDATHSNYLDDFYTDLGTSTRQGIRSHLTGKGADSVSEYATDFAQFLDPAAQLIWNNNYTKYSNKSGLERTEKMIINTDGNGVYTKSLSLKANSVYLFEIENCFDVALF